MTNPDGSHPDTHLGDAGRRAMMGAFGVGGVGVVLSAALFFAVAPDRFFRSYLTAFMLVLTIALGGLIFTLIQHATRAGWSVTVRRIMEILAGNLTWLWVLFIPVAIGMLLSSRTHLYQWNVPAEVAADPIIQGKTGFLNPWFWMIRAVVMFSVWGLLARFYLGQSVAQDSTGNIEHTHRMQRLAPVSILLFALTLTVASIDWVMSLEATWFSTIFGVYLFAVSAAALFSSLILVIFFLQRAGKIRREITTEHFQDLGKLLFAFGIVFWAYIAFSQFMLIWYANVPEETTWFMIRSLGGWWGVSLALLLGHFVLPFLFLISRHPKRSRPVIAGAAMWMLVMVFIDLYWLVMPQAPIELLEATTAQQMNYDQFVQVFQEGPVPASELSRRGLEAGTEITYADLYGFRPHLVDLSCVLALLGIFVGVTIKRMGRCSLVPVHDPRLAESLAFENI